MTVLLTPPSRVWVCQHCPAREATPWDTPNRFHPCPGLAGVTAPMVLEGSDCRVTVHEREDYIGKADVQLDDNGRPIMNVTTERPDGSNDVMVFPETVHMRIEV